MENATIIIGIFAVVVISIAVVFRQRISAKFKGPGDTGLELDASNPTPRPGVQVKDATSRSGGLTATDQTGRGVDIEKIDVNEDIKVTNRPPQESPFPN